MLGRREAVIFSPTVCTSESVLLSGTGASLGSIVFIPSCCILLPQDTANVQGYPPLS